ncbi:addiction module toxin RelE [bacterium C-53]|nr:addiction module toxin RelE [Lachnospiraceae bacterium]NBI04880.1 addiction module toxin RelE [Lachnospiraceae bacterium]RKJ07660.1 addiction module toxin RelE [bacterium C-53]
MTLTENEKRMVFQLEGCNRYDAIQEIAMFCQYTRDHDKRNIAENLLKKLRELSENDCRELICDIQKNYNLPRKAKTVGEMIAVARQESGARKLEGHDIMALERFDPEVAHMIVFDVLSRESPIGDKGHRMRLFLTEVGYKKALESQDKSFIRILNHAKVAQGHLRYDQLGGER